MKKLQAIEDLLSVLALLTMALLPLAEMTIRPFYPTGIPGSTLWVQHLVLWVTFLGAAVAAREKQLLSLASGDRLFAGRAEPLRRWLVAGIGFSVCLVLAKGGWDLIVAEREGGSLLALGVPVWVVQLVMPVGWAVIGWRLLEAAPGGRWGRISAGALAGVPLAALWFDDWGESGLALPIFLVLLGATALGAPIFVGLGGIAALLLWSNFDPVSAIAAEAYGLTTSPILPTVPLFTLAGYILAEGETPHRLVALFRAWFGWIPGGIALVALLVCAFFTSFTGGSGVTILAMGGLLYPMLREARYPERFSTGLLTSAGSLGLLFPPSLAVILYGLVAQIDIRQLFVSGMVPGILEIALVGGFALLFSRRTGRGAVAFSLREALSQSWRSKWEALIPLVVLGAILGGFATLAEAAALMVLYALVLEFGGRRRLSIRRDLLRVAGAASTLIGGVLMILAVAKGLTNYLIIAEIPAAMLEAVQDRVGSRLLFLLLLNLFLLLVGCLMDVYSAIAVVVPLIAPLGMAYGVDPFHLGIIFLVNLELGYLTPPVGMNLFLASYRFERPLTEVYRAALPFLGIRALAVLLVTYFPPLTQALPRLLGF